MNIMFTRRQLHQQERHTLANILIDEETERDVAGRVEITALDNITLFGIKIELFFDSAAFAEGKSTATTSSGSGSKGSQKRRKNVEEKPLKLKQSSSQCYYCSGEKNLACPNVYTQILAGKNNLQTWFYGLDEEGRDFGSPVGCQIIRFKRSTTYTYPFHFYLDDNALNTGIPAILKDSNCQIGSFLIKLRVQVRFQALVWFVAEKEVRFPPFINLKSELSQQLIPLLPIHVTKRREMGVGSVQTLKFLQGTLSLNISKEDNGFLPGESLDFILEIERGCPKGTEEGTWMRVREISVTFLQEVNTYTAGKRKRLRNVSKVLVSKVKRNPKWVGVWEESIQIPEELPPTFEWDLSVIEVLYFLQFCLIMPGHADVKGRIPIFIGTTRESPPDLDSQADGVSEHMKSFHHMLAGSFARGDGDDDDDSNWDARSMVSTTSKWSCPPNYSALSSRRPSIETLPPRYDELELPLVEIRKLSL